MAKEKAVIRSDMSRFKWTLNEMKKHNYNITYDIVEGRDHCNLTDDMREKFLRYTLIY